MRLVDSNEQSARYANDIEKLIKLAKDQNTISKSVTEKLTKSKNVLKMISHLPINVVSNKTD